MRCNNPNQLISYLRSPRVLNQADKSVKYCGFLTNEIERGDDLLEPFISSSSNAFLTAIPLKYRALLKTATPHLYSDLVVTLIHLQENLQQVQIKNCSTVIINLLLSMTHHGCPQRNERIGQLNQCTTTQLQSEEQQLTVVMKSNYIFVVCATFQTKSCLWRWPTGCPSD